MQRFFNEDFLIDLTRKVSLMLNNEQEPNKGSLYDFLPDENETNKFLRPGFTGFDRGNSEARTTPDVRTYILFNDHHIIIPKPKSNANFTLPTKDCGNQINSDIQNTT